MKPYEHKDEIGRKVVILPSGRGPAMIQVSDGDLAYANVGAAQVEPAALALYEAAGLPLPLTLARVTPPLGGPWRPWEGSDLAVSRRDREVLLKAGSLLMAPAKAREMAAVLVAYADEAENEPDPAEVRELAAAIKADYDAAGAVAHFNPNEIAARTSLRWMRDREAQS